MATENLSQLCSFKLCKICCIGINRYNELFAEMHACRMTAVVISPNIISSRPHTVERQWLEHLWNHKNMFETGVVRANGKHSARSEGIIWISFAIFFNMKVRYVLSLKSPHQENSSEYTKYD